MFWASIPAGLALLGQWEVWVAVGLYVLGTFGYLLMVGMMMGDQGSGVRMGVGCVFHTFAGPIVQGLMMAIMVAFLLPVMLSGGEAGGLSLSELASWWLPVVVSGVVAVVVVVLLCFIPVVGGIISESTGIMGFLMGIIVLRLLVGSELESLVEGADASEQIYPGFWASVGFLVIGAVLVWLLTMGVGALIALASQQLRLEGPPELAGLALGPALGVLGGIVPLLMYGSYISLAVEHGQNQGALVEVAEEPPPLTADELDRYSKVMAKLDKQPLTDADLSELWQVQDSYTKRTGYWTPREAYDVMLQRMETMADYQCELGQCLLMSWDRRERFTTSRYRRLVQTVAELGLRESEQLEADEACLEAAARNQDYVEDSEGGMYEFGREVILQKIRENEMLAANWERITPVLREFVR